jgi:hypothetical protein
MGSEVELVIIIRTLEVFGGQSNHFCDKSKGHIAPHAMLLPEIAKVEFPALIGDLNG